MSGEVGKEFFTTFRGKLQELRTKLEALSTDASRDELTKALDDITKETAAVSKYLTDSTPFLPAYDNRSSQTALAEFKRELDAKRTQLVPKKKFAFKARQKKKPTAAKQPASSAPTDATKTAAPQSHQQAAQPAADHSKQQAAVEEDTLGFKDKANETLHLTREVATNSDVTLKNLENCTVLVEGAPGAIHASNLKNTTICIGPVSRSLLIDHCDGCKFVLACQQLRVHNTYDTDFYLHVTSRAIIEDCDRVRFAPFNWKYDGIEDDYKVAGLDTSINNWDKVNDFKWIKPHVPSPHWCTIPNDDRHDAWPTIASLPH
ncbi:hypothetical protein PTSG_03441 [Salpingoeca rosetta]|uniref:C-CAP/cofactor C-like domain-containing protein n=1 Tax=Salpingoeca rosetta (strain ATCC 50818 / BSB-021) TaxID=946362 RepID=F2U575_SALR5|nr:uncharacterized protein PTSG_03441 [Salpingoeca rosetta]EGD82791.1 hypothetical protein PTSG_03441 [Salpingoeca rosetta]|eukprot:XP_004996027.1 hypothetical protein PTSG_03441 [Salpingoeca rosetta]